MLPMLQEFKRVSLHKIKTKLEVKNHVRQQPLSVPSSPSSACHSALHCWACQGWFLLSGCIQRTSHWRWLIMCWRPCLPACSWVTCYGHWWQGCRTSGSPRRWALKQSGGKKTHMRPVKGQRMHGNNGMNDLQQLRNSEIILKLRYRVCILGATA